MSKMQTGLQAALIAGAVTLTSSFADAEEAGYPIGDRDSMWSASYITGSLRHMGEIYTSEPIAKGDKVFDLPRGAELGEHIGYKHNGVSYTIEDYFKRSHTSGIVVLKDGAIRYERYLQGADEHSVFASASIAKSVTSTLFAFALGDGLVGSVDEPVSKYLPELNGSGYENVPIKAVLQMSSGVEWDEEYSGSVSDFSYMWQGAVRDNRRPVTDFVVELKRAHEPFADFNYSGADTIVLGWLVTRVTGKSLMAYLGEKMWRPLGMEADANWVVDGRKNDAGEGPNAIAFCCFSATLRDYARFGLLMAQDGVWQGKRLLPEGWVAAATRPDMPQVQPGKLYPGYALGYQYQWWTFPGDDQAFTGQGVNGQFLYVNPAENLVIAVASAWPDFWVDESEMHTYALFDAVKKKLSE